MQNLQAVIKHVSQYGEVSAAERQHSIVITVVFNEEQDSITQAINILAVADKNLTGVVQSSITKESVSFIIEQEEVTEVEEPTAA